MMAAMGSTWEYKTVPLKWRETVGGGYDLGELNRLARDGWECVGTLPLPKPDSRGAFHTTMAHALLKRAQE